jgi:hypothetical protein
MGVQPWPQALVLLCGTQALVLLCDAQALVLLCDSQEAELSAWLKEWTAACAALEGRDEKMGRVAEALERDMELLGATAVEDKLQVGVGGGGKLQAGLRGWSGTSWGMV